MNHPPEMEISGVCRLITVDARELYWSRVLRNALADCVLPEHVESILKKLEPWQGGSPTDGQ